ncbi:MAG TPA: hypothetical protein VFW78_13070 [Bacteroidia bacterium]|nr:hypothetical protein [Bacteroidia bacterium]
MKYFFLFFTGLLMVIKPSPGCCSNFPVDGVYFSFEEFRAGSPGLVKNQLYRELDKNNFSIRQWTGGTTLYFITGTGLKLEVGRDSIWGYAENGTAYVQLGGRFHKIATLGTISYFLETYPVIGNNPAPVVTETKASSAYRLLDMETGDFLYYSLSDFMPLLERDEELYKEFESIDSPKVRKKKMYSFLERYNKAHPLVPGS